jgi:hypothetical protein
VKRTVIIPPLNATKTIIPLLLVAVTEIFGDYTVWVGEDVLSELKRDCMFGLILLALLFIPFESNFGHD